MSAVALIAIFGIAGLALLISIAMAYTFMKMDDKEEVHH